MTNEKKIIIENAFNKLGKQIPPDRKRCIYKTGLVDSFELMQLILEIELMASISIDLEKLTNAEVSLEAIEMYINEGMKRGHE